MNEGWLVELAGKGWDAINEIPHRIRFGRFNCNALAALLADLGVPTMVMCER